jgi:ATP-binding protein involved in chromosome partitioning
VAAAEVAERAGSVAVQTRQRVVGVVENMAWLEQPDGSRLELFGAGGGERVAANLTRLIGSDVPVLGQVPIDVRLREAGDGGTPVVLTAPDSPGAVALREVARGLAGRPRNLAGRPLGLSPVGR